ncbi:hypothetical protein CCP3SC15_1900001 [Gammaproteobacteria bacterium]
MCKKGTGKSGIVRLNPGRCGGDIGGHYTLSRVVAPIPLTDTAIRNAKPEEKPFRLFDGGGMYLEIAPSGGKWWRLKYRIDGKEKRLSLGIYPNVSLKDARDRRDKISPMVGR